MTDERERLIEACVAKLADVPGPFRTYANPQRSDGVFVSQDRALTAYPGVCGLGGRPLYPAVPLRAKGLHHQLPHDVAAEVVRRLNARQPE